MPNVIHRSIAETLVNMINQSLVTHSILMIHCEPFSENNLLRVQGNYLQHLMYPNQLYLFISKRLAFYPNTLGVILKISLKQKPERKLKSVLNCLNTTSLRFQKRMIIYEKYVFRNPDRHNQRYYRINSADGLCYVFNIISIVSCTVFHLVLQYPATSIEDKLMFKSQDIWVRSVNSCNFLK